VIFPSHVRFLTLRQALCALPLVWLWFVLINDLRVEWTVNPQYSYGWAVPFLCAFLLWQKFQKPVANGPRSATSNPRMEAGASAGSRSHQSAFSYQFAFIFLTFLYAPIRLIEMANPGWRLMSWALAIEVVGVTLIWIRLALGASRPAPDAGGWATDDGHQLSALRPLPSAPYPKRSVFQRLRVSDFVFPVCFFLVAVPWPSHMEGPLIQGLTRLDTAGTTELLSWLGIPAMPHGNVIEVATGTVGIDEACSGIRSFQATLMISLFLGEFYSLGILRRVVCVIAGFALSFLFNLARMSLLVWVAACKGVAAIASWHDPAGVTILVACFFSLWGLGALLKGKTHQASTREQNLSVRSQKSETRSHTCAIWRPSAVLWSLALGLGSWIVISEVSIEAWYRWHEARVPIAVQWTVAWPVNNPAFKEIPLSASTLQILRFDEGRSAFWHEDSLMWQAVFLRWKPGRTAIHLAQNHTPAICMTAAGHTLNAMSPQEWIEVNGLRMPFLAFQVMDAPQPFFVFYCLWDDRSSSQGFETMELTYGNRLAPVLAGLRNPGQRSLEIAVSGADAAAEAEAAVRAELEKLIVSKP